MTELKEETQYGAKYLIREDDYSLFKDISMITYGLLLDDVKSSIKCIDDISNGYYISDFLVTNIDLISKYIFIFKKVALLVSIVLAILIVVYLAFYEMSNISSNKREIGILKAIGMKQRTISMIFIFQQILLSIMVFVTAMLFSYILIRVANNLLQSSIRLYAEVYIASITLIRFRIGYMLVFLALTIVVIMASCIIPILLLTRIKPMNIIKAKE
jgi:ABC-type antimicrobial peptide transport system permease subunit